MESTEPRVDDAAPEPPPVDVCAALRGGDPAAASAALDEVLQGVGEGRAGGVVNRSGDGWGRAAEAVQDSHARAALLRFIADGAASQSGEAATALAVRACDVAFMGLARSADATAAAAVIEAKIGNALSAAQTPALTAAIVHCLTASVAAAPDVLEKIITDGGVDRVFELMPASQDAAVQEAILAFIALVVEQEDSTARAAFLARDTKLAVLEAVAAGVGEGSVLAARSMTAILKCTSGSVEAMDDPATVKAFGAKPVVKQLLGFAQSDDDAVMVTGLQVLLQLVQDERRRAAAGQAAPSGSGLNVLPGRAFTEALLSHSDARALLHHHLSADALMQTLTDASSPSTTGAQGTSTLLQVLAAALPAEPPRHADMFENPNEPLVVELLGDVVLADLTTLLAELAASPDLLLLLKRQRTKQEGDGAAAEAEALRLLEGLLAGCLEVLRILCVTKAQCVAVYGCWDVDGVSRLLSYYDLKQAQTDRAAAIHLRSIVHLMYQSFDELLDVKHEFTVQKLWQNPEVMYDLKQITEAELYVIVCRNAEEEQRVQRELDASALKIQRVWRGRAQRLDNAKMLDDRHERDRLSFIEMHEVDRDATVLRDEHEKRETLRGLFTSRREYIIESERLATAGVTGAAAELQQRLNLKREAILTRQDEQKKRLAAAHQAKLQQLTATQKQEVADIEREKADLLLLDPMEDDVAKQREAATLRETRLKQQHAKARLYLRGLFLDELEAIGVAFEEELAAFDATAAATRDLHLFQISEERDRGFGLAGRVWWAEQGICAEQRRAWEALTTEMNLIWMPSQYVLLCNRIATDEINAHHVWEMAEILHRERTARRVAKQEGVEQGALMVEAAHRGVISITEDEEVDQIFQTEVTGRGEIQRWLLEEAETAAREPILAYQNEEFIRVRTYRDYELTWNYAQSKCREGFSLMCIQLRNFYTEEADTRAALEKRFREQESNIADSSMAGHEMEARAELVQEEKDERKVIKTHFDAELLLKDIDRLLALVETQETTGRGEVDWEYMRETRHIKSAFYDDWLAICVANESKTRQGLQGDEAAEWTAVLGEHQLYCVTFFEGDARTGVAAEHHVTQQAILRMFAAESQTIAHMLQKIEFIEQEESERDAVGAEERTARHSMVEVTRQANGERIALNDTETAARHQIENAEKDALREAFDAYVASTTTRRAVEIDAESDVALAPLFAAEDVEERVLRETHARGALLLIEEAVRAERAAEKAGDLLDVFRGLQQQLAYEEVLARGYIKDRCDMGFMVIHNAWLLENASLMLAEERFQLLRAQHTPRMKLEALEARARLELYSAFNDTSGATAQFIAVHLEEWSAAAGAIFNEYTATMLEHTEALRDALIKPLQLEMQFDENVLKHSEFASRCIVQRGDAEHEEYTFRVCVEFDEAHAREALWDEALASNTTTRQFVAARAIQCTFRRCRARRTAVKRRHAAEYTALKSVHEAIQQERAFATGVGQEWFRMLVLHIRAEAAAAVRREASVRRSVKAAIAAREAARRDREEQQRRLDERVAAVDGECRDEMRHRILALAAVPVSILVQEEAARQQRAVLIQTYARARMTHPRWLDKYDRLVRRVRARWAEREFAAKKIQEFRKSRLQVREAKEELSHRAWAKQQKENEFIAAYILRRCAAGSRSRQTLYEVYARHRNHAAATVQQSARACLSTSITILRKRRYIKNVNALHAAWQGVKSANLAHIMRRARAIILVQRAVRGHLGRQHAKQQRAIEDTKQWRQIRLDAVMVIQRLWRGRCGRRRAVQHRRKLNAAAFETKQKHSAFAATQVQKAQRGALARAHVAAMYRVWHAAGTKIQCAWRQRLARKRAEARRVAIAQDMEEARKPGAATMIQTQWRCYVARKELAVRRFARDEARRIRREATALVAKVALASLTRTKLGWAHKCVAKCAGRLVTFWRICVAKKEQRALTTRLREERIARQRHNAAGRIQRVYTAHYRRRMGAAYRVTHFLRRVTPHVRTARAARGEVLKMRLLRLRKVERLEAMERTSVAGREAEAFRDIHVHAHAFGVRTYMMQYTAAERAQLDDELRAEAEAAAAAVPRLSQRDAADLFYEQRKARNAIVLAAVDELKTVLLAERAGREKQWGSWTVHALRKGLEMFLRDEQQRRAALQNEQISARRLLRARMTKLLRIDRLKRNRAAADAGKPSGSPATHGQTFPPRRPQGALPPLGGATLPPGATPLPPLAPYDHPPVPRQAFAAPVDETSSCPPGSDDGMRPRTPLDVLESEAAKGHLGRQESLICLDASNQHLGDTGCVPLLARLRRVERVLSLRLDNNNLGDASVKALAELLTYNRSITSISLSNNSRITDDGATCLINALKGNPCVRFIDTDGLLISQNKRRMLGFLLSGNAPNPSKLMPAGVALGAGTAIPVEARGYSQ